MATPVYAAVADFEAYVPGWVTDDAAVLDNYLAAAERDVEGLFPLLPILTSGTFVGHRFDTTRLDAWEATALKNAVCAQAEYLIAAGDDVASGAGPTRVSGPDFTVDYAAGAGGGRRRYSAKLPRELAPLRRYRARSARARV